MRQIWQELKTSGKGFSIESAHKLIQPLSNQTEAYVTELGKLFPYSMMTVLKDISNARKYNYLEYVEFLEFLCRVAHKHWQSHKDDYTDITWFDIEKMTENLIRSLYSKN